MLFAGERGGAAAAAHTQGLGEGFGDTTGRWQGGPPPLPCLCLAWRLKWHAQHGAGESNVYMVGTAGRCVG